MIKILNLRVKIFISTPESKETSIKIVECLHE